jgi:hypothetical protein
MTPGEVRWVQGAVVILLDNPVDMKQLVRDTDYALLDMMGKIKHRGDGLPAVTKWPNAKGWPFKH